MRGINMYEQLLLQTRPFQEVFYSYDASSSSWLIAIFVALICVVSAAVWYRSSHAHDTATPLRSSSTTEQTQHPVPVSAEGRNGASSSIQPPVLICEIVPEQPSTSAESEKDQILAKSLDLEAELSECNAWNDRLRARLNSRDAKIGKLQIQLMEIPMSETLVLQLEQKETVISALERRLQTQKDDYDSISRIHQENLQELERRDESYTSTVAALKSTYDARIKTSQVQHETNVQQMRTSSDAKLTEMYQRAIRASSQKTQILKRCEELEDQVIEIQRCHAELVKREQERELQQYREQTKPLDEIRSLREKESLLQGEIEYLHDLLNTRDDDVRKLNKAPKEQPHIQGQMKILEEVTTRDDNIEELKRTIAEQKDPQEKAVNRASLRARVEASVVLLIHDRVTKRKRALAEGQIKTLQEEVDQKTGEIQALDLAHSKVLQKCTDDKDAEIQALQAALAQAPQSQKDHPNTNSVELDVALKQLAECQNKSQELQADWEAAHLQVSEMVPLLCDREKCARDKTAELEAEKERTEILEKKLESAQRWSKRAEQEPKGLQTIEEETSEEQNPRNFPKSMPEDLPLRTSIKGSATGTINQLEIISGDKHDVSADGTEKPRAKVSIDWSKVDARDDDHERGSKGASQNSSTKTQQASRGVRQPAAQLPKWLDVAKLKEDAQKEADKKVASLHIRVREQTQGNGNIGHEPRREESTPSYQSEEQQKDHTQTPHDAIRNESSSRNNNRGRGRGGNHYGRGHGSHGRGRDTDNNRGNPGHGRCQSRWTQR